MTASARIFLSYARQDRNIVEDLYQKLADARFRPWMDKDILAGEVWKSSIQRAVQSSHFFLACLSKNSVSKRGYLQKEIKFALGIWQGMLEEDIYLIPVRLEDCEVPVSLREFQWVNLFEADGWERLVNAIRVGMERRGEVTQPVDQKSGLPEPYSAHKEASLEDMIAPEIDGHPPDIYALYEIGLRQLVDRIGQGHPDYPEALVYRQRLIENITQSRRYGDTPTRKAERAEITDRLNAFALSELGVSFSDLCGLSESTATQEPSEHSQREDVERTVRDVAEQVDVQAQGDPEQIVTAQDDTPAMTNEAPSTSQHASVERSEELYNQGLVYLHCRSLEEATAAVAAFRELIGINPEYKEDARRRLDEAKEKAHKLGDLEDNYRMGRFYFDRGQWSDAIVHLKPIADWDRQYKDAATLLAQAEKQLKLQTLYADAEALIKEERWEEAIKSLQEIVNIDPAYGGSEGKLGQARAQHKLQSLYEQAIDHFREEKWPQAIGNLETILQEVPSYRNATEKLKEAQEQQELAALRNAGVGFQGTGRWEEAIDKFMDVIRLAKVYKVGAYKDVATRLAQVQRQQELDRRFKQGEDYARQGKWKEAVIEFEWVYALDPSYRGVQAKLEEAKRQRHIDELRGHGETSLRENSWQEAVKVFEELHGLDPRDGSVVIKLENAKWQLKVEQLYQEGMEYLQRKKWRKARTALEEINRIAPGYRDVGAQMEIVQQHLPQGSRIVGVLRDPLWQGIGAVVAVIALIVAMYPFVKEAFNLVTPTPKPATLCNGDFEKRNFECWQHDGELSQSVKCDGGQCYAVLGSSDYKCEGGVPVGEAWIKQSFQVPETVSPTLSLRYRVFSYDLDDQDFFQVNINGKILGPFGNTEWGEASCDLEAWDSGWQPAEFDLGPYRGRMVEVSLHNVNGAIRNVDGTKWWNTWTYVDDVKIR